MLLGVVVETSRQIGETTRRLAKVDLLARLLSELRGDEIDIAVGFLTGAIRQGRIGLGYATLGAAAAPPAERSTLELAELDRIFESISGVRGSGSAAQRSQLLAGLFARSTEPEQRFLIGLLTGELRQGALEGVMLDALGKASGIAPERVRRAVMLAGGFGLVARAALESGDLSRFDVELFRPVAPMLAQPAEKISDAIRELGEAALEFKMDGARIQVHKSGEDVRVYTRSLHEVTLAAPEVVEAARALPARDLILDGEVLSLEPGGRPRPFQETMRRFGRKLDVEEMRRELPLAPFWFDLIYLDGQSLIDEPQARRFAALGQLGGGNLIPRIVTANATRAEEFLAEALARGHEGIMAKALQAPYQAGARGQNWLKVKQARTLDLVILAAEWGHGRRKGWLSNLHLGARDTDKGGFAMLGKTFKGLTDEMLEWQTRALLPLEIGRDSYTVFVEPRLVAEIAFNEIQVSPRYASGLALRFARVKRYRADKSAAEADTFQTVRALAGM